MHIIPFKAFHNINQLIDAVPPFTTVGKAYLCCTNMETNPKQSQILRYQNYRVQQQLELVLTRTDSQHSAQPTLFLPSRGRNTDCHEDQLYTGAPSLPPMAVSNLQLLPNEVKT